MADEQGLTEAQIAVHWREEEYYHPPASFIGQANAADPRIHDQFREELFPECFKAYADLLDWDKYWHTTLDTSNAPFWKWFVGGRLNASYNCVDRHLEKNRNKAAFIWVPEPEDEETVTLTYQELYERVNEFAALLRDFCGVKTGDRITFHLPMTPELPVAMLACARLGVIHSEVFGGFSGNACGDRIVDSGSNILITMDSYYRNGDLLDHKVKAEHGTLAQRAPLVQPSQHLPCDRFALAVGVGGEDQPVRVLERRRDSSQRPPCPRARDVGHGEILGGPHRALLRRKVAHMAERREHAVAVAEIPADRLRLGGRFHDHHLHGATSDARPASGSGRRWGANGTWPPRLPRRSLRKRRRAGAPRREGARPCAPPVLPAGPAGRLCHVQDRIH